MLASSIRLLASPHYGERWGRYWLDVARYGDNKGYVGDNKEREIRYAYLYRDWVIRALNNDLPYDQFLVKQIAADRLPHTDNLDLPAMGLLTVGRRFLNDRQLIIDDQIDVASPRTLAGWSRVPAATITNTIRCRARIIIRCMA